MPLIVSGTDSITIPVGTTAQRNATPVAGMNRLNSSTGVPETYNGTSWTLGGVAASTAVASTSGTSISFTGIPTGVKKITVLLNGTSWSGTANLLIQIGAGSTTTTGYVSSSSQIYSTAAIQTSSTSGFVVFSNLASNLFYGAMVIHNITGNTWTEYGTFSLNTGATATAGGGITLGGTLDRVIITTSNGTDTFDAGTVNVIYE